MPKTILVRMKLYMNDETFVSGGITNTLLYQHFSKTGHSQWNNRHDILAILDMT
jgi:hypothetical protein